VGAVSGESLVICCMTIWVPHQLNHRCLCGMAFIPSKDIADRDQAIPSLRDPAEVTRIFKQEDHQ
jgi:hypothetical protein